MKVLEVKNLSFTHPAGNQALHDINFDLDSGETLAVIGPNGAGKTSLFLALCGLTSFRGEVKIFGEKMTRKDPARLRQRMSLVFQNPDDQLFMPTVGEDLGYGLEELGYEPAEVQTRVEDALARVGLAGYQDRSIHHMSYGEKRRVTLAIAFARSSEILLLDEPTRELDPGGRREFKSYLKEINATKLIASHDLDLVAELASRVLLLDKGQLVSLGDPHTILTDHGLMEAHRLEVPHVLKHLHPHH